MPETFQTGWLIAALNVHTKSPRVRSKVKGYVHDCNYVSMPAPFSSRLQAFPQINNRWQNLHAAYLCTERLTSCSPGKGVGMELQEEAVYKPSYSTTQMAGQFMQSAKDMSLLQLIVDSLVGSPLHV